MRLALKPFGGVSVKDVVFSPDENYLAVTGGDNTIFFFEVRGKNVV
jgi:WD40 repeat protein